MSAYDNDPRVTADGVAYLAVTDAGRFAVLHTATFGWVVCHGPSLEFASTDGGYAIGYKTADEALHAVVGEPQ